ncbi:hypothetical protein ES703_00065 [subsurface metagenome]
MEKFSKCIWVCKEIGGKVYHGMLSEIQLPLEMIGEFSERFLKIMKEAGIDIIGYKIDKTSAEIVYKIPKGEEAEVMQKFVDIMKKEELSDAEERN